MLGVSYEDCWFGSSDTERAWNLLSYLNMFNFVKSKTKEAGQPNNGKTATDMYMYFRLALWILADDDPLEDKQVGDAQKKIIVGYFNKKADVTKYKVFAKDYILERLRLYLGISRNTWNTGVQKLQDAGLIYLSESSLTSTNCVHIIIPPVRPTEALIAETERAKQNNNNNNNDE